MGLSQITAALYARHNQSVFERFPVTGLISTPSSSHLITDSAAGATAFSCGCKTYNGAIGVNSRKKPCKTLFEIADSLQLATGIAVNCTVTHATPASFVAHVHSRKEMEEIAPWFLVNQVDFLVGGGAKYFGGAAYFGPGQTPKANLLDKMRAAGYIISQNAFDTLPPPPDPKQPFCWLTASEEPPKATVGRNYLPAITAMGTQFLKERNAGRGFIMLIEGSQVDWAGHGNDRDWLLAEMKDFENSIAAALDFAQKDGETLVVVTADHETGGMSILQGSTMDTLDLHFNTKGHTASMIPVFAYGPGAELFGGIYENTGIFDRLLRLLTSARQ